MQKLEETNDFNFYCCGLLSSRFLWQTLLFLPRFEIEATHANR